MAFIPRKAPQYLFGREEELRSVLNEVQGASARCIVVHGPSGIGKSEFLRALEQAMGAAPGFLVARHEIIASAETRDHVIRELASQLLSSPELPLSDPKQIAKGVLSAARDHTWSFAAAALLDGVGQAFPAIKTLAEAVGQSVRDELGNVSITGGLQTIRENATPDLLAGFIAVLGGLEASASRGVLMIDKLEAASGDVLDAVTAIATNCPSGWTVILSVNDEIPEGIDCLHRTRPVLTYHGAIQVQLESLTDDAVADWYSSTRGERPSRQEVRLVNQWCQGRPLMLRDWVSGLSRTGDLRDVWKRLGPYYDQRVAALPEKEKGLVRTLALLPPGLDFTLALVSAVLGNCSVQEAYSAVEGLIAANFVEVVDAHDGTFRLVHDVTRLQLLNGLPSPLKTAMALQLAAAVSAREYSSLFSETGWGSSYTLAQLYRTGGDSRSFLDNALPAARELASRGAHGVAGGLFEGVLALNSTTLNRENELEARFGLAQAQLNGGLYEDALATLAAVATWPEEHEYGVKWLQAKLLLRLNRYDRALALLDEAEAGFQVGGQLDRVAQCRKDRITILRDLGHYELASSTATDLFDWWGAVDPEQRFPATWAACARALARSLAFTGPLQSAQTAVSNAHLFAERGGDQSDIGNAYLAEGEVLRLGGLPQRAVGSYAAAADIARTLGNRDSLIWALLGEVDSHLLTGQAMTAKTALAELEGMVLPDPSRHPLETLHFRLSAETQRVLAGEAVDSAELNDVVANYEKLGVLWPRGYVDSLLEGRILVPKCM